MIRGDFHSHTTFSDGTVSPGRRVIQSLNAGNAFQWVTDHDEFEGGRRAQRFAQNFGLPISVFPGVEFSTDVGHVIALGMRHNPFAGQRFTRVAELIAAANQHGWLLVLAHATWPSHRKHWLSGRIQTMFHHERVFHALELVNMYEDYLELMDYYDQRGPFAITAGSDSHHEHQATAECWLGAQPDETSVLQAIREARVAVWAGPELTGRALPAFGRSRWFGTSDCIAQAQKAHATQTRAHNPGFTLSVQADELLPGERCILTLSSETELTVRVRAPLFDMDETVVARPGSTVTHRFTMPETREGDYVYWLAQADQPQYYALADCFVKPRVRSWLEVAPGGLCVVRNDGATEPLPAALSPVQFRMQRFTGWDALPAAKIAPEQAPSCAGYRGSGRDATARVRLGWDREQLYVAVDVTDECFCQPFENRGLWEGDCIRMGIAPARIGVAQPRHQPCQREWFGRKAMIDFALTPEGPEVLWKSKLQAGQGDGLHVAIQRTGSTTEYRARFAWEFLQVPAPQPGAVYFINLQLHEHDGRRFRGFITPQPSCDLDSPEQSWPLAIAAE